MADLLIQELRGIYKAIEDLNRRQANAILTGKVAAVEGKRVRLELMQHDGRTGKPFLSPWVQVQEAAGITASHMPVKVGDPMRLLSPNGELGSQSLAVRDSHTDSNPNPAAGDELVLAHNGAKLTMSGEGLVITFGNSTITLSANGIQIDGAALRHNAKNIGDTHTHSGIERGGANTNPPNS